MVLQRPLEFSNGLDLLPPALHNVIGQGNGMGYKLSTFNRSDEKNMFNEVAFGEQYSFLLLIIECIKVKHPPVSLDRGKIFNMVGGTFEHEFNLKFNHLSLMILHLEWTSGGHQDMIKMRWLIEKSEYYRPMEMAKTVILTE